MMQNRNLTIALFVFLTLAVGAITASSSAKSVYAQNNALTQNGGGNANPSGEQPKASYKVNQIVSKANDASSGNNLQCQKFLKGKVNSKILDQICNSRGGVMPSSQRYLVINLETPSTGLSFSVTVQPLNNLGKPIGSSYSFNMDGRREIDYRYVTDQAAGLKVTVTGTTTGYRIAAFAGSVRNGADGGDTTNWSCSLTGYRSGSCEAYKPQWAGDKLPIMGELLQILTVPCPIQNCP